VRVIDTARGFAAFIIMVGNNIHPSTFMKTQVEWEGADWINFTQDGDKSQAVFNTVMNTGVP
jgi:hypothetical protein